MLKSYHYPKKLLIASLFITLTQTGCLCGFAFWPLWFAGGGIVLTGALIGQVGLETNRPELFRSGVHVVILGTLLGEKQTGHVESLNQIPRDPDLAKKISVSIDEISDYNDNLNHIQTLGKKMIDDLTPVLLRIKKNELLPSQLNSDSQLNELAKQYGFGSTAELLSTRHSKLMPKKFLEPFAKATELSTSQARIFLFHSFGILCE